MNKDHIAPTDTLSMILTVEFLQADRFDSEDIAKILEGIVKRAADPRRFKKVHAEVGYRATADWVNDGGEVVSKAKE